MTRKSSELTKQVVAALFVRTSNESDTGRQGDGEVLVCQRRPDQFMPLKWEFPGGKIEPGETPHVALQRELREELGVEAEIGRKLAVVRHTYQNGSAVELQFFLVKSYTGEITNHIFKDVRWEKSENLAGYDFLEADQPLVRDIAAGRVLEGSS